MLIILLIVIIITVINPDISNVNTIITGSSALPVNMRRRPPGRSSFVCVCMCLVCLVLVWLFVYACMFV